MMARMTSVKLYLYSNSPHCALLVTGFHELMKEGKINLQIDKCSICNPVRPIPFSSIVEAEINNRFIVAFDMLDGYNFDYEKVEKYLASVDFYFKRSFSPQKNMHFTEEARSKIHPISLNWNVSYPSNPTDWGDLKSIVRKVLNLTVYRNDLPYYEHKTKVVDGSILFRCELWDPNAKEIEAFPALRQERVQINETRIAIIRALKKKYGNNFNGGVVNNAIARQLCPELILPKAATNRRAYINAMKHSSICIATTGLHESIGWKFAEYVAAGKPIVTEPLHYEIIGDFKKGKNYLEFTTPDECLAAVESLLADPDLRESIIHANLDYYFKYARPDRQVAYVLDTVLG